MPLRLKRGRPNYRKGHIILCSTNHKGLADHPKGEGWIKGYRTIPPLLQEAINYFDNREEEVYNVLTQLEKSALLIPGIWRCDIVLRTLHDPFNEDPNFLFGEYPDHAAGGYIMGLLIPYNIHIPMQYFRLLAFRWIKWNWYPTPPWTAKLIDPKDQYPRRKKITKKE